MENNDIKNEGKQDEVVAIELPAPAGWIKKFTPHKGGTPRRNDVKFISPTGEEIKNKRQLDHYLKSHPGEPSASEFDWGTGDTPRRSARLSGKSKATESLESETPKKQKKSSAKKGAKEQNNDDGEDEAIDNVDANAEETKESAEVTMADAEAGEDGEVVAEEALPDEHNVEETEKKTEEGEAVTEEHQVVEIPTDATDAKVDNKVEGYNNVASDVAGAKIEESENVTDEVTAPKVEDSNNATTEVAGAKVEGPENATNEVNAPKVEESKAGEYAENETAGGKVDTADPTPAENDKANKKQEAENPAVADPVVQEGTASY